MPDIAKCDNRKCPLSKTCYRFTSEPSFWQSYAPYVFTVVEGKTVCDGYWKNKE